MVTSLPKLLARGTNLLGGKPIYLKVGILQPTLEGQEPKMPLLGSHSPHPSAKSHQGSSTKGGKRGQHDHGSEGTPIMGSVRHVWTRIRELYPRD